MLPLLLGNRVRLCPEYLRLVYIRNVHFGGVHTTHSLAHATSSSLSELKFAKLCKSQIVELLQFTEVSGMWDASGTVPSTSIRTYNHRRAVLKRVGTMMWLAS